MRASCNPDATEAGQGGAGTRPASAIACDREDRSRQGPIDPWLALFVAVLAMALVVLLPRPLSSDISAQLWIAQHIRQGARLYVDIFEINPPLWFWMALPVNGFAGITGFQPESVLLVCVAGAAFASLAATDRLLGDMPAARRRGFLLYAALVLLVMPAQDIGQREMLALLGALPYAALAAARQKGRRVSLLLAVLIGLGAAAGFALKHYFLGVPVLLELWLWAGMRREWRPVRPETIALAAVGIVYGAAILIVTPEYLSTMVPLLGLAYGAGGPTMAQMLLPAQVLWLATGLAMLTQIRLLRTGAAPLTVALLIAAAGFAVAWLIQHKGWPYHSIPTTGMLALAFAAMLAEAWDRLAPAARKLAPAILILPLALALVPTHAPVTPEVDIAPSLAGLSRGASVAIVSTESFTAWPATLDHAYRFPSRYGLLWMLDAIDADAAGARDPRIAAFGREVVRQTIVDYRCLPPERIVFVRPDFSGNATTASADPLKFFLRDPEFAKLLGHYTRWQQRGMFETYRLAIPLDRLTGAVCRRGV